MFWELSASSSANSIERSGGITPGGGDGGDTPPSGGGTTTYVEKACNSEGRAYMKHKNVRVHIPAP